MSRAAPEAQGHLVLPLEVSRHVLEVLGGWVTPCPMGLGWCPGAVLRHPDLGIHQRWQMAGLEWHWGGLVLVGAVPGDVPSCMQIQKGPRGFLGC